MRSNARRETRPVSRVGSRPSLGRLSLVLATVLLAACTPKPTSTPTPTLRPTATAFPTPTPKPTADGAAAAYLNAWQTGDYAAMYALLAPESQAAMSQADLEKHYRENLSIMAATGVTAQVTGSTDDADAAQVQAHVVFSTLIVGNVETDINLDVKRVGGVWRVVYSPTLIWPELVNGQRLYMAPLTADRATIYDRNGAPMVELTDAYAIGLVPNQIVDPAAVEAGLGRLLGVPSETIHAKYEFAVPDQYLPLAEVPAEDVDNSRFSYLFGLGGIQWSPYTSRFYYGNGGAAHATGYISYIQPEELEAYRAKGYAGDERVGKAGLEAWGEATLAGKPGGQLMVVDANGNVVRRITAAAQPVPGQDIYSTVDFELQKEVQAALEGTAGAAVVLNLHTGEVLALASSPTFDPNLFDVQNVNSMALGQIVNDYGLPLFNRATQLQKPAGSVFKVVTMAAAMTSGLFTPETTYECTGTWDEVGLTTPLTDWKEGGHGVLTLQQGLTASCNPWFWHIGNALYQYDPAYLSQTARAFGLGAPTGLAQLGEAAGLIPDPDWMLKNKGQAWGVLDGLNLAIGQGDVLVTPIQIARAMAAIGNGGTLYQPQLVSKIQSPDGGTPTFEFAPIATGQLPLKPEQLAALQEGLHMVTVDCAGCIGTARNRFRGLPDWLKVAGKTGTAEDPGEFGLNEPDAWFAGYTFANRPDKPDIAIAVVIANRGGGSSFAAPVFRRIVEAYFGLSYRLYPWEAAIGVTSTPTPTGLLPPPGSETPTP